MTDHYIKQAKIPEVNLKDYVVLLSKPRGAVEKVADFLVPSPSYQVVIYIDDKKQIYAAKVSVTGRFTKAVPMADFTFVRRSGKTVFFSFTGLDVDGDFDVARHGNKTLFDSAEHLLAFLAEESR